jgi:hypothetical protein
VAGSPGMLPIAMAVAAHARSAACGLICERKYLPAAETWHMAAWLVFGRVGVSTDHKETTWNKRAGGPRPESA